MERLGLVALPRGGRAWRMYAGPLGVLLAVTVAVGVLRTELRSHKSPTAPTRTAVHKRGRGAGVTRPRHVFYVVRAGDTISGIAGKTGIATSALLKLNPTVTPTALFIGEKIRLK